MSSTPPEHVAAAKPKTPALPRGASRPVMFAKQQTGQQQRLLLVQLPKACEVDLRGDTGAVGRFSAVGNDENVEEEEDTNKFELDLKGDVFHGTLLPSAHTVCVMEFQGNHVRIEAVFDEFLRTTHVGNLLGNRGKVLEGDVDLRPTMSDDMQDGSVDGDTSSEEGGKVVAGKVKSIKKKNIKSRAAGASTSKKRGNAAMKTAQPKNAANDKVVANTALMPKSSSSKKATPRTKKRKVHNSSEDDDSDSMVLSDGDDDDE